MDRRKVAVIILSILAVIVLAAILVLLLHQTDMESDDLTFRFLEVGQGDAAFIVTPYGCILIDAGPNSSEVDVLAALKHAGVERISYAIFTHAHEDHIGGADAILTEIPTDYVVLPVVPAGDAGSIVYRRLLSHMQPGTELLTVTDKTELSLGEVVVTVYPSFGGEDDADGNENGLFIRVAYRDVSVLFTGDAGTEQEELLLEAYGITGELCSTVLHVGHHGSDTSTGDAFLKAVSPSYAVISVGAGNSYGHPTSRVLARLGEAGAVVLRTDVDGNVVLRTNGQTIKVGDSEERK